jgi:hypothetical protein
MTEFIRDTIANLNGIYYVASMNAVRLRSATNALPAANKKRKI